MAYSIYNSDGTLFATVNDGTVDTSSSVTLVGKNWAGYGAYLDENFLHLLQNFSSAGAPPSPITGQLWYNPSPKLLQIWTGTAWKPFQFSSTSPTPPLNPAVGDLWFDSSTNLLKAWDGSAWLTIGPAVSGGTGVQPVTLYDGAGQPHNVVQTLVNGNVVGIVSQDTFAPVPVIPGFTTLVPGLNLATTIGSTGNVAALTAATVSAAGNVYGNTGVFNSVITSNITANVITATSIVGNIGNASSNITANNLTAANTVTGNNVVGNTGTFGNLVIGNVSANGSYGNVGDVLTSNGAGQSAYWAPASGGGGNIVINNDTTSNATLYPMFANVVSGNLSTAFVSNTGFQFNPANGTMTVNTIVSDSGIALNKNTISANYAIPAGYNGVSAGPITLAANVVVSVPAGSAWTVV